MTDHEAFNRALAEAARKMQGEPDAQEAMDTAVRMATAIISGCDMAGVSIVHSDGVDTPATSHDELRQADEYQYTLSEGPCFDALREQDTVMSRDLTADERWPKWGPHVARELGMHSIMSYQLFSDGPVIGALNLYGSERSSFTNDDLYDGLALAAHVAVALAAAQEVEHLKAAITTRTVIGQATGMLMERFDLDADTAFGVLARLSSQQNMKLRTIAEQVVQTRTLPQGPQPDDL